MEFLGVVLIGNSIMKKILYVLVVLCICTIGNAQEYKIEEIENIAYSFFNSNVQQDARSSNVQKSVATIEAIRRDSTNYMYLVNGARTNNPRIAPRSRTIKKTKIIKTSAQCA